MLRRGRRIFPAVVAAYRDTSAIPATLSTIRGIVYRVGAESIATGPAPLAHDLDAAPIPDFDEYFAALDRSPAGADVTPTLLMETSRGCWWGARHHCTFCGLNGGAMTFRSKSPDRVVDELTTLVGRYRVPHVNVVDNILDMRAFTTFLPELRLTRSGSACSRDEGKPHRRTGRDACRSWCASHPARDREPERPVLQLMRKGTTALQNVALLKWCREHGVVPEWNLLYGFPGEDAADYAEMLPLIDAHRTPGAAHRGLGRSVWTGSAPTTPIRLQPGSGASGP